MPAGSAPVPTGRLAGLHNRPQLANPGKQRSFEHSSRRGQGPVDPGTRRSSEHSGAPPWRASPAPVSQVLGARHDAETRSSGSGQRNRPIGANDAWAPQQSPQRPTSQPSRLIPVGASEQSRKRQRLSEESQMTSRSDKGLRDKRGDRNALTDPRPRVGSSKSMPARKVPWGKQASAVQERRTGAVGAGPPPQPRLPDGAQRPPWTSGHHGRSSQRKHDGSPENRRQGQAVRNQQKGMHSRSHQPRHGRNDHNFDSRSFCKPTPGPGERPAEHRRSRSRGRASPVPRDVADNKRKSEESRSGSPSPKPQEEPEQECKKFRDHLDSSSSDEKSDQKSDEADYGAEPSPVGSVTAAPELDDLHSKGDEQEDLAGLVLANANSDSVQLQPPAPILQSGIVLATANPEPVRLLSPVTMAPSLEPALVDTHLANAGNEDAARVSDRESTTEQEKKKKVREAATANPAPVRLPPAAPTLEPALVDTPLANAGNEEMMRGSDRDSTTEQEKKKKAREARFGSSEVKDKEDPSASSSGAGVVVGEPVSSNSLVEAVSSNSRHSEATSAAVATPERPRGASQRDVRPSERQGSSPAAAKEGASQIEAQPSERERGSLAAADARAARFKEEPTRSRNIDRHRGANTSDADATRAPVEPMSEAQVHADKRHDAKSPQGKVVPKTEPLHAAASSSASLDQAPQARVAVDSVDSEANLLRERCEDSPRTRRMRRFGTQASDTTAQLVPEARVPADRQDAKISKGSRAAKGARAPRIRPPVSEAAEGRTGAAQASEATIAVDTRETPVLRSSRQSASAKPLGAGAAWKQPKQPLGTSAKDNASNRKRASAKPLGVGATEEEQAKPLEIGATDDASNVPSTNAARQQAPEDKLPPKQAHAHSHDAGAREVSTAPSQLLQTNVQHVHNVSSQSAEDPAASIAASSGQHIVSMCLSMNGKTKHVRHAFTMTIEELLHRYGKREQFVAKDESGFELGREVTLGQLASCLKDRMLNITLEPDSF